MAEHKHQISEYDYQVAVTSARMTEGDVDEHLMGFCCGTSHAIRGDSSPHVILEIVDGQGNA